MQVKIEGIGPDAPIDINDEGGEISSLPYRFDLIPPEAAFSLAETFYKGIEKGYKENNWRLIDRNTLINHALSHIFAYLAGDKQDNHLNHALCRLAMAVAMEKKDEKR